MIRNIKLNVLPSYDDLPPPRDWLLTSLTNVQIEAALMRAAVASHSCYYGDEIVKFVPHDFSTRDAEYVIRFTPTFERILCSNRLYVAVLVSPVTHKPDYGYFCNRALSTHLWQGQKFEPSDFFKKLRLGVFKFLGSPDSLIYPPPPEISPPPREGHVPVRMFVMKIEQVHAPSVFVPYYQVAPAATVAATYFNEPVATGCNDAPEGARYSRASSSTTPMFHPGPSTGCPYSVLIRDLQRIFAYLPPYRYAYTGSVYLMEKPEIGVINARCVGYGKRVLPHVKA